MSHQIIGFTGKIGSGKSLACEYLRKKGYTILNFSDPLKKFAEECQFDYDELYGTQADKKKINDNYGISGRNFMQSVGTDLFRTYLPSIIPDMKLNNLGIWARIMQIKLKKISGPVCIGDIRYLDESTVVSENGHIIKIIRDTEDKQNCDTHSSETTIISVDHVLTNNGTKKELYDKIDAYLLKLGMPIKIIEAESVLTVADTSRFVQFPIKHGDIWEMYKNHQNCIWIAEHVSLDSDLDDWKKLTHDEQHVIKLVSAFFAQSDGIVLENLIMRLAAEIKISEARNFYGVQMYMENVHSEIYAQFINTYVSDKKEQDKLFNAIDNFKSIKLKADWALKWIDDKNASLAQRLIAFVIVEGVFFSTSFAIVFWLQSRGLMAGFGTANQYIARDEGLHTDFGILLFKKCKIIPSEATILEMFEDAIKIEDAFIDEALPKKLRGINSDDMKKYLRYVTGRLLSQLGIKSDYPTNCNLDYMNKIGIPRKTNFFEHRNVNYQLGAGNKNSNAYEFLDD